MSVQRLVWRSARDAGCFGVFSMRCGACEWWCGGVSVGVCVCVCVRVTDGDVCVMTSTDAVAARRARARALG